MKTIAHITDPHLDESFPLEQGVDAKRNWYRMLDELTERGVRDVVFGGDIGDVSAHPLFFESLKDFETNIVLGNHDQEKIEDLSKAHEDGHYYFYDDDLYRYIILDSSEEYLPQKQIQWLEQTLITDKKVILFVHHPILEVPSYVDSNYALQGRDYIQQLLFDTGLDVTIFCGHYHLVDERQEKNIRQLVTPAISYQMVKSMDKQIDSSQFGGRLIHISPDKIDTEVIILNNH